MDADSDNLNREGKSLCFAEKGLEWESHHLVLCGGPYQRQTRRGPHGVGRHQHPPPRFHRQPPHGPRCRPSPQPCRTWVTSLVCFAKSEIGKARASRATIDVAKAPNSTARQTFFHMSTPLFTSQFNSAARNALRPPSIALHVDLFSIVDGCPELPRFSHQTNTAKRLCPPSTREASSQRKARTASAVTSPFCPPQVTRR